MARLTYEQAHAMIDAKLDAIKLVMNSTHMDAPRNVKNCRLKIHRQSTRSLGSATFSWTDTRSGERKEWQVYFKEHDRDYYSTRIDPKMGGVTIKTHNYPSRGDQSTTRRLSSPNFDGFEFARAIVAARKAEDDQQAAYAAKREAILDFQQWRNEILGTEHGSDDQHGISVKKGTFGLEVTVSCHGDREKAEQVIAILREHLPKNEED